MELMALIKGMALTSPYVTHCPINGQEQFFFDLPQHVPNVRAVLSYTEELSKVMPTTIDVE